MDEVAALVHAFKPDRLRALVLVLALTGSEVGGGYRAAALGHLRQGAKAIRVSRAVTHRDGCRVYTPKSGKGRTVIVPPHIRATPCSPTSMPTSAEFPAQLFPAVHGCHLNDRVFRSYLAPALKSIGREEVRIHDLRHTGWLVDGPGWRTSRKRCAVLGHSTAKASPPVSAHRHQAAPRRSPGRSGVSWQPKRS